MPKMPGVVGVAAQAAMHGREWVARIVLVVPKPRLSGIWAILLVCMFSMLVLGCGTVASSSRKATGVELSHYRTFDFAEAKQPSDQRFYTPAKEALVKAAIRTELEKRGLHPAEPADLEFCVYLKTATRTLDKTNPSIKSGSLAGDLRAYYGLLYDNSWGTQDVVAYPEGTLVVQAVDVKQNRKVWEGVAKGVLYRDLPEKQIEARIQEAVAGMFKDFPGG